MKSLNRLDLLSGKATARAHGGTPGAETHHFPKSVDSPDEEGGQNGVLSLRVHRSLESLETLEMPWRRLTPAGASPFQTFTWNLAWYRLYAASFGVPAVFEVRRSGETIAILPCYFAGRTLRLAGDITCGCQDVIAGDDAVVLPALGLAMDWLKHESPRAHFHFEKISSEGLLFRALHDEAAAATEGRLVFEKSYAPCPCVGLRGGLDSYLASLPRKIRQDLRNSLNRLEKEAPAARVVRLEHFSIRVDDLENAAAFHIGHFRKAGLSPLHDRRLIALLGCVAKDPDVGFQLSFLADQGDLLAVDFGFVRGGRYYGYLTTYDPAFSRLAPGICLLLKRIDSWVQEDGVHTLDFPAGDEHYKKAFTGGAAYRVWSMRLMPRDLLNRARQIGLESNKRFRSIAKGALRKTRAAGK
jgi:CelD/BcsL family acetyltransferase involved in cellulose biosynthesis